MMRRFQSRGRRSLYRSGGRRSITRNTRLWDDIQDEFDFLKNVFANRDYGYVNLFPRPVENLLADLESIVVYGGDAREALSVLKLIRDAMLRLAEQNEDMSFIDDVLDAVVTLIRRNM